MKKSCGKKLWRACAGILLALAVWIAAAPYAVAARRPEMLKVGAGNPVRSRITLFPGKQERKEKNRLL